MAKAFLNWDSIIVSVVFEGICLLVNVYVNYDTRFILDSLVYRDRKNSTWYQNWKDLFLYYFSALSFASSNSMTITNYPIIKYQSFTFNMIFISSIGYRYKIQNKILEKLTITTGIGCFRSIGFFILFAKWLQIIIVANDTFRHVAK